MAQLLTKPVLYVCNVEEASAADGNIAIGERSLKRPRPGSAEAVVISRN
jgi:ribosome-binding ATPase YchF (GTP1/OBG family)